MSTPSDDLQNWIREWQDTEPASRPAPAALARHVRRRSRQLAIWIASEAVVGVIGLIVVGYLALTLRDPIERLAMALLALACAGSLVFGWLNWRGAIASVGETTAAYLDTSVRRLERIQRAVHGGWILFAAELAVMTPWVWYRRSQLPEPAPLWPWVLLIVMGAGAVVCLILAGRWLRRERSMIDRLRSEDLQ